VGTIYELHCSSQQAPAAGILLMLLVLVALLGVQEMVELVARPLLSIAEGHVLQGAHACTVVQGDVLQGQASSKKLGSPGESSHHQQPATQESCCVHHGTEVIVYEGPRPSTYAWLLG